MTSNLLAQIENYENLCFQEQSIVWDFHKQGLISSEACDSLCEDLERIAQESIDVCYKQLDAIQAREYLERFG